MESLVGMILMVLLVASAAQGDNSLIVAIPGSPAPLLLNKCIEEALESNAALQAERQRREELSGQKKQALSLGLPSLDLTGSWRRGRDPSFALDESFTSGGTPTDSAGGGSIWDSLLAGASFLPAPDEIPAQTFWRTSVNARWEIRPGLIYNAVGAAGVGLERQEALIADAENRTVEGVLSAYYSVVMAGEQLAALDAELAAKHEFLEVTRRRFYLGLSTGLDTLRAAVTYANLIPLRRSAAQALRDTASRLNILMGRSPLDPLTVSTEIPLEPDVIDPAAAEARVARRPDIRQIELYETILRKNRGAQKADLRPYLSADASYGYVTREIKDLVDKGHDFWSASVMLTIPLFDGLLTKGRIQEAEASIRRSRLEREEAIRQARLEISSLLGELDAARANLEATAMNLTAADDALRQVSLRYELGKADYLSVLDSQAGRFLARSNYIEARNRVLTLTASLKRALGFSPILPLVEIRETILGELAGANRFDR